MMTVKITGKNSGRYEYSEFPMNRYEFIDRLDQAGIFGEYTVSLQEIESANYLRTINLSDAPTVDELDFLAKRLENVFENKYKELAYSAVISQYESVSISEAINRTYGLETVLIYPCNNAAEYGEIVLENDFLDEIKDLLDEVYDLLDRDKIGRLMQEREGGIFMDGYYIIPSSHEPQLVYNDVLPEAMDNWLFKLEVTVMDGDDPNEDLVETLTLPATEERMNELENKFGKPVSDWVWLSYNSGLEQFWCDAIRGAESIGLLNEFAVTVSEMPRHDMMKFKAAFNAERPENISEAMNIAATLDRYDYDPNVTDLKNYGEKYLMEMLPPDFDRTVLTDGLTGYLGKNISEKNGSQMTSYGMISSADGGLYEMIEAEQTFEQGQTMSL